MEYIAHKNDSPENVLSKAIFCTTRILWMRNHHRVPGTVFRIVPCWSKNQRELGTLRLQAGHSQSCATHIAIMIRTGVNTIDYESAKPPESRYFSGTWQFLHRTDLLCKTCSSLRSERERGRLGRSVLAYCWFRLSKTSLTLIGSIFQWMSLLFSKVRKLQNQVGLALDHWLDSERADTHTSPKVVGRKRSQKSGTDRHLFVIVSFIFLAKLELLARQPAHILFNSEKNADFSEPSPAKVGLSHYAMGPCQSFNRIQFRKHICSRVIEQIEHRSLTRIL